MHSRRPWATALLVLALGALTACAPDSGDAAEAAGTPLGSVWVANEGGDSLTVLDAAGSTQQAVATGLPAPHNVQASEDGSTVWAVSGGGVVVALDADGTVRATGDTDAHPAHVVGAADGRVVVTATDGRSLTVYDAQLRVARRIELPGGPHGVRLTAAGDTAVVANTAGGTVDVVDLGTGQRTASIPVGASPVQVAVSDDGRWAFASVSGAAEVVKVDLRRRAVVARAKVPAAPAQVLLTAAGELLTADQGTPEAPGSTVSVLDPDTLETKAEITVGKGPHGLAADPTGTTAWVTNQFDDSLSVLDLESRRTVRTVTVGDRPNGVTYSPEAAPRGFLDLGLVASPAPPGAADHGSGETDAHDHAAGGEAHG